MDEDYSESDPETMPLCTKDPNDIEKVKINFNI
jgi:hypothetical protein